MSESTPELMLWDACSNGDDTVVRALLNTDEPDVNPTDEAINVNWVGPDRGDTPLHRACRFENLQVVKTLLKWSAVDVNARNLGQGTPLYIACQNGRKEVVPLLLADRRTHVNKPENDGATPFYIACEKGHKEVVALLLEDLRIDINRPEKDQCTPLWMASQLGMLEIVQLMLASGRDIDTKTKSIAGPAPWNDKTAAEVGRRQATRLRPAGESDEVFYRKKKNGPLIEVLLDTFDLEPGPTRQRLRELPGIRDPFIGDIFGLVIFLCDDLLTVSAADSSPATRFFKIAQRLPMELQMVLCHRAYGSGKSSVLTRYSEPAFKKLGRLLARTESH